MSRIMSRIRPGPRSSDERALGGLGPLRLPGEELELGVARLAGRRAGALLKPCDDGARGPEEEDSDDWREDENGEDVAHLLVERALGEAVDEGDDLLEDDGELGEEVARDDEPSPADEEGARVDDEVLAARVGGSGDAASASSRRW